MINRKGEVFMDISIKELDKINELVMEHKGITDALNQNIICLLQYDFKTQIYIGEVGVEHKDEKSYKAYNFEISFKKADEINEIIQEHRRLVRLLYDNMDKLRYYHWSVEIAEALNE